MRVSRQEQLTFWILLAVTSLPIIAALWPVAAESSSAPLALGHRSFITLQVCLGTIAIAMAIGIPAGMAIRDRKSGQWALAASVSALALPPVVHASAWLTIITREAALNSTLYCALIQGIAFAPIAALAFAAATTTIDPDLDDAARLEGTGVSLFFARLQHLYAAPLASVALIVGILAATTIAVTDLLLIRTLAEETFTRFQVDGYAGAARLILPVSIFGAYLGWRFCPNLRPSANRCEPAPDRRNSRYWYAVPLMAGTLLPIVFLFNQGGGATATLSRCSEFRNETLLSLVTASASTLIGLTLAWSIAWCGLHKSQTTAKSMMAWLAFSILTPGCFVGMGLIRICARPALYWLYDSPGILVAAQMLRILPFQVLILTPFILAIPSTWLEEASLHKKPSRLSIIRLLARPLGPGLTAAAAIGFTFALQEIDASALVAPPGTPPLALRFFTLLHYGLYPDVASMGILIIAGSIIPVVIFMISIRKITAHAPSKQIDDLN